MEKIHYTRKEYREQYLRSKEWRKKSAFILKRDPICRVCEKENSRDAHHLTYERIHFEHDSDLIGVCRGCHNIIHKHSAISSESNLDRLRELVRMAGRKLIFEKEIFERLSDYGVTALRKAAGILKVPVTILESKVGKRVGFTQYLQLSAIRRPIILRKYPKKRRSFSRM